MGARRLLTDAFVGEATLEVPDGEMASLRRVIAGAIKRRALPLDAAGWLKNAKPKTADTDERGTKSSDRGVTAPGVKSDRTGRVVPGTNRFVQSAGGDVSRATGPASRGGDDEASAFSGPAPGKTRRAWSALRGVDPSTGLRKAKSAVQRVRGKASRPYPNLPEIPDSLVGAPHDPDEYRDPFPWMKDVPDDADGDPAVDVVSKAFSRAKRGEREEPPADSDFEKDERTDVETSGREKSESHLRGVFALREAAGPPGLRVSGDAATLGALQDALHEASASISDSDDLAAWCEAAYKAVAMGMRRGGDSVTLPPFEETPDLDGFNDGGPGAGPDEEEI